MTPMAVNQRNVNKTLPTTEPQPGGALAQSVSASASLPPKKHSPSRLWGIIIGVVVLLVWIGYLTQWQQLSDRSFIVWVLLGAMIMLGVAAACSSICNVYRSRTHFEQQRAADMAFAAQKHYASVRERVRDVHFAPFLPGGPIAACLPHRMHHVDRLQIILSIVRQDETEVKMPALDDLRTHSYSVEKALWHNWILRIVISVLLITGILGTLAGVHGSLEGGSGVDMALLPQAFLPSLVAVVASIILILMQAWYRYLFDTYMGRVDCHTLRYYFPWFRPDVLNEQSLKQFETTFGQLSEALKRLGQEIERTDMLPQELQTVADAIGTMLEQSLACTSRQSVNAWRKSLKKKAEELSAQVGTVLEQQHDWSAALQQLSAATEISMNDWEKVAKLDREMKNKESEIKEKKKTLDDAVNSLPDANEFTEKLDAVGSGISLKVYEIACHCKKLIEDRYRLDVEQANVSKECIAQITKECETLSAGVQTNVQNFEAYVKELETAYTMSEDKVAQSQKALESIESNLSSMRRQLQTRIEAYNNEPILHKWQIALLGAMGAAFLINLCITLI